MIIFIAVFCSVDPMAFITFVRSAKQSETPHIACKSLDQLHSPISVLGVASVTSRHHDSQQTSSSPFALLVNQPRPAAFLLLFSKSSTTSDPLTLLLGEEFDDSCRMSCPTRVSIKVSSSGSATSGRVKSSTSIYDGMIDGKYLWKKMV